MSERTPVGRFAAEKIRQAAYAEVWEVVCDKHRDFGAGLQFLGA